jgi:mannose-6-phosphate isomerase-like protein (cupin superfamily)
MNPTIVLPGNGSVMHAFGEEVIVHLDGAQTGGKLTLWTAIAPPGGGPPPHYHLNEDELLLVQEGKMEFFHDNRWDEVEPGGAAFMPRKSVHTFKNTGNVPSRMLVITGPSGFEAFFARCSQEFAKEGGPDMQRVLAICAEHGIHFVSA